jgi:putative acetyltransferase
MMIVRPEREGDYAAIREINALAFGRENEARLVENLRRRADFIPELSLVAVKDRRRLGHILFSPILIQTDKDVFPALALSPIAVHPEFQHQGIGAELLGQGLRRCRNAGHEIIVVIGHPSFYPRFGFTSARVMGLEAPFFVPDEAFMVLELVPGALNGISGMVVYPPEFEEV